MQVAIVHNAVEAGARADEQDVLVQVAAVKKALAGLGHNCEIIPVDLNLSSPCNRLSRAKPEVIFNLIESLGGADQLASLAAAAIESVGVPITGSSSTALWLTSNKVIAKQRLLLAGLPTPAWVERPAASLTDRANALTITGRDRFILKPTSEHASLGMDETAIVQPGSLDELVSGIRRQSEKLGRPCFAEQFISGREFNVSLLANGESCQVLPLAEINFSAFPAGKPQIVGYRAKWDRESFEYRNTPRQFLASDAEPDLARRLNTLASQCWSVFQLGGYARVDFRVDEVGQPWILEVNTNPCLSPGAGYAAALEKAEIRFATAVQRILANAVTRPLTHQAITQPTATSKSSRMTNDSPIQWRYEVTEADPAEIRSLVAETGFFYPDEVDIAEELFVERLAKGAASGYHFVIAEIDGKIAGYANYGHIAGTRDSYDLYWIAVHPRHQGKGIGRVILEEAEKCIRQAGGRRVYIETSNREQYQPTRFFYSRCGYEREAVLADFYGPGDDKVIYVKVV